MIGTACKKRIRRVTTRWIKISIAGSARPGAKTLPRRLRVDSERSAGNCAFHCAQGFSLSRKGGSDSSAIPRLFRASSPPSDLIESEYLNTFLLIKIINTAVADRGNRRTTALVISRRRVRVAFSSRIDCHVHRPACVHRGEQTAALAYE